MNAAETIRAAAAIPVDAVTLTLDRADLDELVAALDELDALRAAMARTPDQHSRQRDALQDLVKSASPIMADLVAEHNASRGLHARPGCPGCLLRGKS